MVPGNDWLLPDRGLDPSGGAPHWGNGGPMSAGQVLLPALPGNQPCWISFIDHFVCTKYAGYIAHVIIIFFYDIDRNDITMQTYKLLLKWRYDFFI